MHHNGPQQRQTGGTKDRQELQRRQSKLPGIAMEIWNAKEMKWAAKDYIKLDVLKTWSQIKT